MKQLPIFCILLIIILISVSSCGDEPDGKWGKMKWKVPADITCVDNVYIIPANGGSFKFTCKNYKPWIAQFDHNVMMFSDLHRVDGSWFQIKCEENDVIFTFQPMTDEDETRELMVVLSAGDIFDRFYFRQEKNQ